MTVYRQGAVVTRVAQVNVPVGSHRLVFRGLPADVDAKTLQVTAGGAGLQLGDIEVVRINEETFVSEPERELRRRIEEVSDQQAVLADDVAVAQSQLKLLDSLASNPAGSPNKAVVDATNLTAVLGTMATGESGARKRVREANLQLRTLTRQKDQLQADLAKVATKSKQSTEVRAAVLANTAVEAGVAVSYTIQDARWDWIYQARLDTAKKHLVLDRQGSVTQGSGEDWKNVELTLTTAKPAEDLGTPVVDSLFVDLRAVQPPVASFRRQESRAELVSAATSSTSLQEVVVTGARRRSAEVASTDYVADYHVPSRVSLPADRQARLYPIGENAFEVDLVARVVPSVGHDAHLEALFKYSEALPIEAGQLELYRDGAYVGEADTPAFLPGADVRMPFGVDERIRATIRDEATQSGQKGLINRQAVSETRRRIDITNYHPTAIAVEVLDRIPVSKSEDIHIEILKGATDPTVKDLDGKAGVWLWKLEPAPQQTVTVHQAYAVQYPAGRLLQETTE
ncbi:MAG: mucoidy inhibitor MuiA family protein [Steroidobacteraceae bacterium]